jgi:protein-tyrosine phosphatase
MAERVAEQLARQAGLDNTYFSSAATSTEELGRGMDPSAARVLARHGYRSTNHRARQISAHDIHTADLVIGMEQLHLDIMSRLAPDATNLALITDFDPQAAPGSGIDDPWYGPPAGFETTLALLEAALPGVVNWVRARVGMARAVL